MAGRLCVLGHRDRYEKQCDQKWKDSHFEGRLAIGLRREGRVGSSCSRFFDYEGCWDNDIWEKLVCFILYQSKDFYYVSSKITLKLRKVSLKDQKNTSINKDQIPAELKLTTKQCNIFRASFFIRVSVLSQNFGWCLTKILEKMRSFAT